MNTPMPMARAENIIVQKTDDEYLVYDLNTNKALCLNTVSAEIWKRCDGITTVQEVAKILGKQMNIEIGEDFVWLAIDALEKNKLLENKIIKPVEFENLSRRKVLLKYALPTLVLPLIGSIIAPTAVNAASVACPTIPPGCTGGIPGGIPTGCPCTLDCSNCSGACNLGTMMCI